MFYSRQTEKIPATSAGTFILKYLQNHSQFAMHLAWTNSLFAILTLILVGRTIAYLIMSTGQVARCKTR